MNYKKDIVYRQFVEHLRVLGVSANTLKNYQSDINAFESWLKDKVSVAGVIAESLKDCVPFLSAEMASEFKVHLTQKHQKQAVNRRLSTLRAFSRFLIESQIVDSDFMAGVGNLGTQKEILGEAPVVTDFRKHLETAKISPNTIKNYVSDVKHFLSWLESRQPLITNNQ